MLEFMVTVFGWLRKKREQPLISNAVLPRVKTYSADTGHVYQYVFLGYRRIADGTEYVFSISQQRQGNQRVVVTVADAAIDGLELSGTMLYAVAKIALRRALDQCDPTDAASPIQPNAALVREILAELNL